MAVKIAVVRLFLVNINVVAHKKVAVKLFLIINKKFMLFIGKGIGNS